MEASEALSSILGRDGERAAFGAFLDSAARRPSALVLEGEPGIGKTTLWLDGMRTARDRSVNTLSCRPAESETTMSFTALSDLSGEVIDVAIPHLPGKQARALEIALLRADEVDALADQRTVSTAFLSMIRYLAAQTPLLVAVDDVQWMDRPSASVLSFAIRRLRAETVGILLTRRGTDGGLLPLGLSTALSVDVRLLTLGPLDTRALRQLIAARLGIELPGARLAQLQEASGGNPYFALELARSLEETESQGFGEPLPLPENVHDLVRTRIERLPEGTRDALLAAAALSRPTVETVERSVSRRSGSLLQAAFDGGVLERDGARLRFTHPLLRAAAYAEPTPERRRRMHRRLATVVSDTEERARHLALGSHGPDSGVAQSLEEAARVAHSRGAAGAAGQLAQLAASRTPLEAREDRGSRLFLAGRYYLEAGDSRRAKDALRSAVALLEKGPTRFNALILLAMFAERSGENDEVAPLLKQARADADGDPDLLCDVEQVWVWVAEDLKSALSHASRAVELATQGRDPVMRSEALAEMAFVESMLGTGIRIDLFQQESEAEPNEHPRTIRGSSWILGTLLLWADDLAGARSVLERALASSIDRGDQDALTDILLPLTQTELRAGDWLKAAERADECAEAAAWSGLEIARMDALYARAMVSAHFGQVSEAERDASEGDRIGIAKGQPARHIGGAVLGFVALSRSDPAEAHRILGPLMESVLAFGIREPALMTFLPDEVEALVALGDLDEAARLLGPFERRARRLDRMWAIAAAARCRGLIAGARGKSGDALEHLGRALSEHERLGQPFELGRTLLVMGSVQRRAKRRRDARESLRRAAAVFDQLGASLWSSRTHSELTRIGGRTPGGTDLTSTERRTAELVAAGHTNREVAASMFVSLKTVEANLRRIYQKLGIRSRTELARELLVADQREDPGVQPPLPNGMPTGKP